MWIEKVFIVYEKNMARLLAFQFIFILSLRLIPSLGNKIKLFVKNLVDFSNILDMNPENCWEKYDNVYDETFRILVLRWWRGNKISFENSPKKVNFLKLFFLVLNLNFIISLWWMSNHGQRVKYLHKLWICKEIELKFTL